MSKAQPWLRVAPSVLRLTAVQRRDVERARKQDVERGRVGAVNFDEGRAWRAHVPGRGACKNCLILEQNGIRRPMQGIA